MLAAVAMLLCLGVAQAAPVAESRHGMVVSAQHLASEVGAEILKAGGNAIDAAVAVGYALAVVDPCCGNIGGGGFMLIRRADDSRTVIDFREKAPLAARPDMYLDPSGAVRPEASLRGYPAAGVPGTVMGLDAALQKYGRLDRARVMAPAIALARDGFVLGEADAAIIASRAERLARDKEAARIFLRPDGSPYRAGDRLVQPDLAATLALIAEQGPEAFYHGPIAAAVAAAAAAHGGILTKEDFALYRIAEAEPVVLRLSRLHGLFGAASERRRHGAVRDAAGPRRLGPGAARLPDAADDPPDGRDDAARLYRPQHRVRRPGFRRPTRVCACCRPNTPPRSAPRSIPAGRPRRPRSAPAPRRTKRPRRRIIRSSISTATPSR